MCCIKVVQNAKGMIIMVAKRNVYLDYSKGICIILMVACHAFANYKKFVPEQLILDWFRSFVYQFHMPVFFIVSGVLFKEEYGTNLLACLISKLKHLWVPFICINIVILFLHNWLDNLGFYSDEIPRVTNIHSYLIAIAKTLLFSYRDQLTGPTWFLAALFWANITTACIMHLAMKLSNQSDLHMYACMLTGGGICYAIGYIFRDIGFSSLMNGLVGVHFVIIGFFFKTKLSKYGLNNNICFISAFIMTIISTAMNPNTDMSHGQYENPFFYSLGGVAGTYSIYFISQKLCHHLQSDFVKNILGLVGKNTLFVLLFHFVVFKGISYLLVVSGYFQKISLDQYPTVNYYGKNFMTICVFFLYMIGGIWIPILFKRIIDIKYRVS